MIEVKKGKDGKELKRAYITTKMARDGVKPKELKPIKVVNGDAKTPVKKAPAKEGK